MEGTAVTILLKQGQFLRDTSTFHKEQRDENDNPIMKKA